MAKRLLFSTASPLREGERRKLFLRYDDDARPHALMADATEFVTRHPILAYRVESRPDLGNEARHYHAVHICPDQLEAVDHVRAGEPE